MKGAIRSILFNKAKAPYHDREEKTFGSIEDDPFKYLQVGDLQFNRSIYINTKTFNLVQEGRNFYGGWKHGSSRSARKFSPQGFTFPYQCIPAQESSTLRLVLNNEGYNRAIPLTDYGNNPIVKSVPVVKESLDNVATLFEYIQRYTEQYLVAEINFYETYATPQTDAIIDVLQSLRSKNQIAPVLRIGQGSGYHSITGNHVHPKDHTIDGIHKNRGTKDRKISAKSRKLAFERVGEEFQFYPMGFVQLLDPEIAAHQSYIKQVNEAYEEEQKARIIAIEKAKAEADRKLKIEQEKAEKARQPQMTQLSQFKKNKTRAIDAIVTGKKGNNITFRPMVEGFDEETGEIRYPSGMPVDTVITIQAMLIAKGKKLQYSGSPKRKG
jgi:hypothetical protein